MIQTSWLPSALGPGREDEEAQERFGVKTAYRSGGPGGYWDVKIFGEVKNVLRAVSEWWETGDAEEDEEFVIEAVKGFELVSEAARTAAAENLADAENRVAEIETALLAARVAVREARVRATALGL